MQDELFLFLRKLFSGVLHAIQVSIYSPVLNKHIGSLNEHIVLNISKNLKTYRAETSLIKV